MIKDEIKKEIKREPRDSEDGIEIKVEHNVGAKKMMKGGVHGNRMSGKMGGKNQRQRMMKNKRGRKFKVLKDKNDVQAQKIMTKRMKVAAASNVVAQEMTAAAMVVEATVKTSTSSSDTMKDKKKELPDKLDTSAESNPSMKRVSKIRERKVSLKSRMSKYAKDGKQKDHNDGDDKEVAEGNNDGSDLSSPEGSSNENEAYEECAVLKCSRPSG